MAKIRNRKCGPPKAATGRWLQLLLISPTLPWGKQHKVFIDYTNVCARRRKWSCVLAPSSSPFPQVQS